MRRTYQFKLTKWGGSIQVVTGPFLGSEWDVEKLGEDKSRRGVRSSIRAALLRYRIKSTERESQNLQEFFDEQTETMDRYRYVWLLGFGRQGKWHLLVHQYRVSEPQEEWTWLGSTPLIEESRDIRIATAEQLPALLEAIEKEVQKKLATL